MRYGKCIGILAAVLACASIVFASMEAQDYNFTVVAANAYTNSYILRGEVKAVEIDVAAGSTQAVVITSGQATLFTKTCTADARYDLLYPSYGSTAAALTESGGGAITSTITTNTVISYDGTVATTNTVLTYKPAASASATPVYTGTAVAGAVKVVATGDAGQTATNALKVTLIYEE